MNSCRVHFLIHFSSSSSPSPSPMPLVEPWKSLPFRFCVALSRTADTISSQRGVDVGWVSRQEIKMRTKDKQKETVCREESRERWKFLFVKSSLILIFIDDYDNHRWMENRQSLAREKLSTVDLPVIVQLRGREEKLLEQFFAIPFKPSKTTQKDFYRSQKEKAKDLGVRGGKGRIVKITTRRGHESTRGGGTKCCARCETCYIFLLLCCCCGACGCWWEFRCNLLLVRWHETGWNSVLGR